MTVQFLNASLFPQVTVEIGVSDNTGTAGTWGSSVWGTGTWTDAIAWTDVSDKVRNLTTSWARSRDLNLQPANVLSLILDNRDGRFSPGNTSGPFAAAGVSKIRPLIGVRVKAVWNSTTYPVYFGFVTNWTDQPSAQGKDMVALVQATDTLSILSQYQLVGSTVGNKGDTAGSRMATLAAGALWPFATAFDVGASTLDVDSTTGSALALMQNVAVSGGGLVFADRDGTLTFHGRKRRGPYFATSSTSRAIGTGSKSFTVASGLPIQVGDLITAAGSYSATGTAPTNYMSGTVTAYSGTTLTINVTATGGSGTIATWWFWWTRSFLPQITFGGAGNLYDEPRLSNDITYLYNSVTVTPQGVATGTSVQSTAIATGSTAFVTQPNLGFNVGDTVKLTSSASSANYMQGDVTAYSGNVLTVNVTAIGGSGTFADWTITRVNSVTATAVDADSIGTYSLRQLNVSSWAVATEAATLAAYLVNVYKSAEYRIDSLRVTPAAAASTLWPLVLDAQISDRHSVTIPLPSTTYTSSITRLVHVSGISHSISLTDGWRVTFDYSSATPYL